MHIYMYIESTDRYKCVYIVCRQTEIQTNRYICSRAVIKAENLPCKASSAKTSKGFEIHTCFLLLLFSPWLVIKSH